MSVIVYVVVALVLAGIACGSNVGTLVAIGHDAHGREFGVWNDNGEQIRVGWLNSEREPYAPIFTDKSRGGKFLEIIVKDCDGDGADDLIVTAESPEKYARTIILNGDLLEGSDAEGGFSMQVRERTSGTSVQFSELDLACRKLAEAMKELKKRRCDRAREEGPHNLPERCKK